LFVLGYFFKLRKKRSADLSFH